jgi:hypothetical protein
MFLVNNQFSDKTNEFLFYIIIISGIFFIVSIIGLILTDEDVITQQKNQEVKGN